MTSYLLDTTCLIHLARRMPLAEQAIARLDGFLDLLRYWPTRYGDAVQAGEYRHTYARKGLQLSVSDTLIAAVARRVRATVITENLKDFPMDDIAAISLAQI